MKNKQFQDSIAQVIKHFEGWECYIEVACHENVEFRSLCEDYAVCASSLENWQASDSPVTVQRRKEYTELLAELKQEIHSWLDQRYVHDQSDKVTGPRDPHTPWSIAWSLLDGGRSPGEPNPVWQSKPAKWPFMCSLQEVTVARLLSASFL